MRPSNETMQPLLTNLGELHVAAVFGRAHRYGFILTCECGCAALRNSIHEHNPQACICGGSICWSVHSGHVFCGVCPTVHSVFVTFKSNFIKCRWRRHTFAHNDWQVKPLSPSTTTKEEKGRLLITIFDVLFELWNISRAPFCSSKPYERANNQRIEQKRNHFQ